MKTLDLSSVLISEKDGVCSLVLNRPAKKNALNDQLVSELKKAFEFIEGQSSIKVIVLSGAGNAFCSGADLSYMIELTENSYEDNISDSKSLSELFLMISHFPRPVIAKVMGPALAGGCGLASVCDFIIAEEGAIFGYPEVRVGFVAAMVSTFLIKQIGERKARELLLTGKIISATEGHQIGLINKVASKGKIDSEVGDLIKILLENSPQALQVTKELFNSFCYLDNSQEVDRLAKINAAFRTTKDFSEGVSAFLEKRKPKWTTI
jgi:methylglutaconyl-CoA hydratase